MNGERFRAFKQTGWTFASWHIATSGAEADMIMALLAWYFLGGAVTGGAILTSADVAELQDRVAIVVEDDARSQRANSVCRSPTWRLASSRGTGRCRGGCSGSTRNTPTTGNKRWRFSTA